MRDWFVELRKSAGLTQQNIADRLNITRQMVSAIENGDANPSVNIAKSLAEILNCPWTKFFET